MSSNKRMDEVFKRLSVLENDVRRILDIIEDAEQPSDEDEDDTEIDFPAIGILNDTGEAITLSLRDLMTKGLAAIHPVENAQSELEEKVERLQEADELRARHIQQLIEERNSALDDASRYKAECYNYYRTVKSQAKGLKRLNRRINRLKDRLAEYE